MSKLTGRRKTINRNSKAMECAARYMSEDRWENYKSVFHSMRFKNGKFYRNGKNVIDERQLLARMRKHPAFEHRMGGDFKLKRGALNEYFGQDPLNWRGRNGN